MTIALFSFGQTNQIEQDNSAVIKAKLWYFTHLAHVNYSSTVVQHFIDVEDHISNSKFANEVIHNLDGSAYQAQAGFTLPVSKHERHAQLSLFNNPAVYRSTSRPLKIALAYRFKPQEYGTWGELVLTLVQVAGLAGN